MEATVVKIEEKKPNKDYFPSLFSNKDNSIIILADGKTTSTTFSGMVITASGSNKKCTIGTYSTGWTYQQFSRLSMGTEITINLKQDDKL